MEIIWTEYASNSLKEIYHYYAKNVSVTIAINIKTGILNDTRVLKTDPMLGKREKLLSSLNYDYRYLISGNYKITYRIIDSTVIIIDVFDTRQLPLKIRY